MSSALANSKVDHSPTGAIPASRYLVFAAIALTGLLADLFSKSIVFTRLGLPHEGRIWWLMEPYVGIQTSVNQGALFGMGQGHSFGFATVSIVAVLAILAWLFPGGAARDRLLNATLAAMVGGILGNLWDRLGLWHGAEVEDFYRNGVRDWILFQHPRLGTWPNFNIADSLLVCGVGVIFVHAWLHRDVKGQSAQGKM